MGKTRDGRIVPLVWYNYGKFKVYFFGDTKWHMMVFDKKAGVLDKPLMEFEGDSKIKVIQKMDDYCLKNFWTLFRYRLVKKQEPVRVLKSFEKPEVHHFIPRQVKKVENNKIRHALPRKDVRTRDHLEVAREFADLIDTANDLLKSFVEGLYNVRFMCLCWFITLAILMIGCTALLYFK